jgi:hypothetical protein
MMPVSNIGTRVPLKIRRGADFLCLLTFTNPDGTPIDLTGSSLAAGIWINGQNVASFGFAVNNLQSVLGPPPALITTASMSLAAAASLAIPPVPDYTDDDSCAWWGLSLTDSTGKVSSLLYGPLQLYPALVVPVAA